jgi:quercetin dioxygenase-like cupin family protein
MSERASDLPELVREALVQEPELDRASEAELADALALLALSLDPAAPSAGARARLLAEIDRGPWPELQPAMGRLFDLGAEAVRALGQRARDVAEWVAGPVPGSSLLHLTGGPRVALADSGLVRVEPGVEFPWHKHIGTEISLILQGMLIESTGRVFRPGDVHELGAGSEHGFRIPPGEQACVFGVVLSAGIEIPGIGTITGKP